MTMRSLFALTFSLFMTCSITLGMNDSTTERQLQILFEEIDKSIYFLEKDISSILSYESEKILNYITNKKLNKTTACGFQRIVQRIIPGILKREPEFSIAIARDFINNENITHPSLNTHVIPLLIKFFPDLSLNIAKNITIKNYDAIPFTTYYLVTKGGTNKKVVHTLLEELKDKIEQEQKELCLSDPLYLYLEDSKKNKDYLQNHERALLFFDSITSNNSVRTISCRTFRKNHEKFIEKFHQYFGEKDICTSFLSILKKEESIVCNKRYPIAHGRSSSKFLTDHVFMELLTIYNLYFDLKEIDITCHYAQHYAFPGERWENLDKDHPCYEYEGKSINLPENQRENFIKNGIFQGSKEYPYEYFCSMFGSNLLATKAGSNACKYIFENTNAQESHGKTGIENLFKKLGKALNKDMSSYYKKHEENFLHLSKKAKRFIYGTLLLYDFTGEALEKYVCATHYTHGNIRNEDSKISIDGTKTHNAKKIMDALINTPEKFDDSTREYEYFWPLTDEGTANVVSDEIKTYAFNIGEHDEKLAQEIKNDITKIFSDIKKQMREDALIL